MKAPKTVEIFFIGHDFYWKSGQKMSSIYYADGKRCDWGKVENHIEQGEQVLLRPATDKELLSAYKILNQIVKGREQQK